MRRHAGSSGLLPAVVSSRGSQGTAHTGAKLCWEGTPPAASLPCKPFTTAPHWHWRDSVVQPPCEALGRPSRISRHLRKTFVLEKRIRWSPFFSPLSPRLGAALGRGWTRAVWCDLAQSVPSALCSVPGWRGPVGGQVFGEGGAVCA